MMTKTFMSYFLDHPVYLAQIICCTEGTWGHIWQTSL